MDIHQLKQRIDASGKKLVTLGNEYIKSKDEIAAQKVMVKMFGDRKMQEITAQRKRRNTLQSITAS